MRKLAYEIRQRTEADYRFFRFETASPLLGELDHNLKITDGVLRFRIFKVDPDSPMIEPPPPVPLASAASRPGGRRPGGPRGRGEQPARTAETDAGETPPAAAAPVAEEVREAPPAPAAAADDPPPAPEAEPAEGEQQPAEGEQDTA
jgi:hypothetical protein